MPTSDRHAAEQPAHRRRTFGFLPLAPLLGRKLGRRCDSLSVAYGALASH